MNQISIVIVNYNSGELLNECINSIFALDSVIEIIVVDNFSDEITTHDCSKVRYIYLDQNYGFATGVNVGVYNSKCNHILIVNSDAKLKSENIDDFINISAINNYAISQPKITDNSGTLSDGCGAMLNNTYTLRHNNYRGDPSLDRIYEGIIYSIKGSVFLIEKEIFKRIGGMDSEFWCYWEETDLCHRAHLYGFKVGYLNLSNFNHVGGFTSNKLSRVKVHAYNFANKLSSHLKNFELKNLPKALFCHFVITLAFSLAAIFIKRDLKVFAGMLLSYALIVYRLKSIFMKRKIIQMERVKSDEEIFQLVGVNSNIGYYLSLFRNFK